MLCISLFPGGYAAFSIGLSAFIADISKPDQRAFRMGMIHLASSLGRPLAAPLGAYLLKEGLNVLSSCIRVMNNISGQPKLDPYSRGSL